MDWRTNYLDISSCMLFEGMGDSEADSNVNGADDTESSHEATAGLAEDDAFSCSCENECYNDFDHLTGTGDYVYAVNTDEKKLEVEEEEKWGEYVSHLCDECEDEDVESSGGNCCEAGDHMKVVLKRNRDEWEAAELETEAGSGQRKKKLKVCGAELKLNERDRDRHFWEACLAS